MTSGAAVSTETDLAVRRLIARAAHLADDGNRVALGDLFTKDGVLIVGDSQSVGRDAIVAGLSGTGGGQHTTTNTVISGGSAEGTIHAISDLAYLRREDGKWSVAVVGRYHDTIVQEGGRYLFSQRIFTIR